MGSEEVNVGGERGEGREVRRRGDGGEVTDGSKHNGCRWGQR